MPWRRHAATIKFQINLKVSFQHKPGLSKAKIGGKMKKSKKIKQRGGQKTLLSDFV